LQNLKYDVDIKQNITKMQAYYNEEIVPSEVKENYYEIRFYGDDFDCLFSDREYNEFLTYELKDISIIKNKIKEIMPEGILISGGEPLLQRQTLLNIFNFCKKNKIKTGIITNASKPEVLGSLLKSGIVDTVIVDLKTGKDNFKKITKAGTFFKPTKEIYEDVLKSIRILKKYDQETEIIFRTTVIPGYVFRKETFIEIGKSIKDINAIWELNKFIADEKSLFRNISPPSDNFMINLREILEKEFDKIKVLID